MYGIFTGFKWNFNGISWDLMGFYKTLWDFMVFDWILWDFGVHRFTVYGILFHFDGESQASSYC